MLYRGGNLPRDRWLKEVGKHREATKRKSGGRTALADIPELVADGTLRRAPKSVEDASRERCRGCGEYVYLVYDRKCLDCLA